jgi:prevent-host-death family protein
LFEATADLPALLERAVRGERITITKHGKPVSTLVPIEPAEGPAVKNVVSEMLAYRGRKKRTLDGITLGELLDRNRAQAFAQHTEDAV